MTLEAQNPSKIKVGILGFPRKSASLPGLLETLALFGIPARTAPPALRPAALARWIASAESDGAEIFIAAIPPGRGGGPAAAAASLTNKPVLAFCDITEKAAPQDLLGALPRAGGPPYALLAAGAAGAKNAALAAVQILALNDTRLARRVSQFRARQKKAVLASRLPAPGA